MLIPRQWTRLVGSVFAVFLFVALLHHLEVLKTPQLIHTSAESAYNYLQPKLPYRPQVEEQESPPSGDDPKLATTTDDPSSAATTADRMILEGTRTVDASDTLATVTSISRPTDSEEAPHADPTSPDFRKTVVMGKLLSEDTDWVAEHVSDWNNTIYVVNTPQNETSPTGHGTKVNKAKEATPYLTYIVQHYDDLPDVAAFIHSHQKGWPQAWHNDARDYDAVNMLHRLRLDTVLERGYVNLRCMPSPGCPNEIDLQRNPPEKERTAEMAYPFVYGQFFNMTVDAVREQVPIIATPCCAQFAVSRRQIRQRPKAEYERFLALIEVSEYDDETLGTVMEYMWHILFGREAVHCEDTRQCYNTVYGRKDMIVSW